MASIIIKTVIPDFSADLCEQIGRYLPDFCLVTENADVAVTDDYGEYINLRAENQKMPIIFLSSDAKIPENDLLCVVLHKPFKLTELFDVLRSVITKMDNTEAGYLHFNGYELRPSVKELWDEQSQIVVKLTEKEVSILKYLYKAGDEFVGKNELQKNVWQYSGDVSTHTIETHIYRLRQKAEQKCKRCLIVTNKGGYKLQTES